MSAVATKHSQATTFIQQQGFRVSSIGTTPRPPLIHPWQLMVERRGGDELWKRACLIVKDVPFVAFGAKASATE